MIFGHVVTHDNQLIKLTSKLGNIVIHCGEFIQIVGLYMIPFVVLDILVYRWVYAVRHSVLDTKII